MPMQAAATPPLTEEDRTTIRSIIAKFDQDMLAGNRPALVAAYSEDAILMPPNAPMVRGRIRDPAVLRGFPQGHGVQAEPGRDRWRGGSRFSLGHLRDGSAPSGCNKAGEG